MWHITHFCPVLKVYIENDENIKNVNGRDVYFGLHFSLVSEYSHQSHFRGLSNCS